MDFVIGAIKFCLILLLVVVAYFVIKTAMLFLAIILAVATPIGIACLIYSEMKNSKHGPQK